jgi:hypothetical protein
VGLLAFATFAPASIPVAIVSAAFTIGMSGVIGASLSALSYEVINGGAPVKTDAQQDAFGFSIFVGGISGLVGGILALPPAVATAISTVASTGATVLYNSQNPQSNAVNDAQHWHDKYVSAEATIEAYKVREAQATATAKANETPTPSSTPYALNLKHEAWMDVKIDTSWKSFQGYLGGSSWDSTVQRLWEQTGQSTLQEIFKSQMNWRAQRKYEAMKRLGIF